MGLEGTSLVETLEVSIGMDVDAGVDFSESVTKSASKSVSAGFEFLGAGTSVSVTESIAGPVAMEVDASFQVELDVKEATGPPFAPYILWQFRMTTEGSCPGTVFTNAFAYTKHSYKPPCCLPGYNAPKDTMYQRCVHGSPDVCKNTTNLRLRG